jgi:ectoine hydroxylase-related dioxygenase (phytanoyl-CoA dioxygenase family)
MTAILSVMDDEQKAEFKPVPIEMRRGHASFHHPLLLHGSYENRSERQRRATVINTALDGFRSDSDERLLEGVPPIPRGKKIEGQFFPLLYEG